MYRNATTMRVILKNGTAGTTVISGKRTDIPITGDWNNDGRWDVGIFRPSAATFVLRNGTVNQSIVFGQPTDKPVTGRWS